MNPGHVTTPLHFSVLTCRAMMRCPDRPKNHMKTGKFSTSNLIFNTKGYLMADEDWRWSRPVYFQRWKKIYELLMRSPSSLDPTCSSQVFHGHYTWKGPRGMSWEKTGKGMHLGILSDYVEWECFPNSEQYFSLVHMESHGWLRVNNHKISAILLGNLS